MTYLDNVRRLQENMRISLEAQLRAQRLVHDARNIRQRIAGQRFLRMLRSSVQYAGERPAQD